ncbi:NAD(P)-dependent dehydrogenase (short-subunit alcohol dehydrogenase family) [Roseibium hamelinense]|uniref:NAD(P)-dependent dehydrogenase (Short-subunit alcohol dehydrogenase family) n=1 Tax=Roseibium hamelinense TaxID=150831 RepID=A0A562THJ7_9HYPH|nr:SDR family oxidoreductase [Roseibium hamelinense]MTI46160.1 SDR family oxidoreductase [Roseibium hamelinense]TWI92648.1 NAD(P)-dependent dehydrogenase (short-subunit alcohol dehydrogenase family) [Roseibium hamelinense]
MTQANSDRIIVITGASRGIGNSIATRLAEDGFVTALHYGTSATEAEKTAEEIKAQGGRAFVFQADLSEKNPAATFWAAYKKAAEGAAPGCKLFGIVNNAGVTLRGSIEEFEEEDYLIQQAVNMNAPYFIVKDALPELEDGGRIINISSGVTRIAFPEIIAYAMTKGAIDTFTFTLAKHLGPRGITVNAVAPGVVDTDINASWLRGNQDAIDYVSASSALGRVGQPDDIASVVSFLASNDGRWVTGQVLDATGGTQL